MNKNEKYSIKKYDSIANTYDTSLEGKYTEIFKQKMLELCDVKEGDKVLDVGCGNGKLIDKISHKAKIKAYGIDISPNMIKECKSQYPDIEFAVTSGEKLPFDDGSFDIVTICCVLHHLHNPSKFFEEAKRVLVKDGIIIVGEPCYPLIIRKITDWIVSPLLKAGDNNLFSHKRLMKLFTDNGFIITEVDKNDFKQIVKGQAS
jgi:Methylase involved in ubiquinone/menaquinone biosynthesis